MTTPENVLLRGGPMDGWLVTPDALALSPGWPSVEGPGAYGAPHGGEDGPVADWVPAAVSDQEGDVSDPPPMYLTDVSDGGAK